MELVKQPLIKLKIILQLNRLLVFLRNNLFLISIGLVILLFVFTSYYFILLYIFYLTYLFIKNKKLALVLLIISLLYVLLYFINNAYLNKTELKITGIVSEIKKYDSYQKITINHFFKKYIIYDNKLLDIKISDKLQVSGSVKEVTKNRNEFTFNYLEYLKGSRISQVINSSDIEIKESINIFTIRKYIYLYLDRFYSDSTNSYGFIKALIFGDNSELFSSDLEDIKINNISHLFAISGLHIGLIVKGLDRILSKVTKDERKTKIINIFLLFYILISNFSPSVIRASLLYIFSSINKKHKYNLTSLDLLSLIFILMLLINPMYLYNQSFKLSFYASLIIIITSVIIKNIKVKINNKINNKLINNIIELIIITFILQLLSFGVTININNSINITSIVTNSIFIIYVSVILLPGTFIAFFISPFKYILDILISIFLGMNSFISKYLSVIISFPSMTKLEIFIFYLLVILVIKNYKQIFKNKYIYILIIFLVVYYNKAYLNIKGEVNFLDLYEGDSTVINYPFNDGIIIIDTGIGHNDELLTYLNKKGIRTIDAIFITHNHTDHNGELVNLINNFKVKDIYVSIYDDTYITNTNITKIKEGDTINIKGHEFICINPNQKASDENDNSLVLVSKIGNLNYLFLGDVSKTIEDELYQKLINTNYQNIDVIKVAHHGSKTSTSANFYNELNPKYVVIMTGNNSYRKFPNEEVINTLSRYNVYRTDLDYQIKFLFTKRKTKVKRLR